MSWRFLRQDLEKLHIFTSLLLIHYSMIQRNQILFWFSLLLFFYYIHVFYYLHHVMFKRILFVISSLRTLRHYRTKKNRLVAAFTTPWPRVKKYFFYFVTKFTTPWLRENPFFRSGTSFNPPWLQKKKSIFRSTTTLNRLRLWKKYSFFISLLRSLFKYLFTWPYIYLLRLYLTNQSKKIPKRYTPQKNKCIT